MPEVARRARNDGVLVLAISAALSATHQSATLAAEAVADRIPVRVIDTKAVSMAVGLMAIDLAELAATGVGLDGLETRARDLLGRVGICGTLDTLEHLVKGGRVGEEFGELLTTTVGDAVDLATTPTDARGRAKGA